MMTTRSIVLASLAAALIWGQNVARPEFEVASIRPAAPVVDRVNIGVHVDGAQMRCTYLSVRDYIRMAYDLKDHQIIGPDWINSERFDIAAKVPDGMRPQVREMLQTLLVERFQLKSHHESRDLPVYALTAGKGGPKLKESPLDAEAQTPEGGRGAVNVTAAGGRGGVFLNLGRGAYFQFADNKIVGKKMTTTGFAETLARFTDRPVVDMTGLTGTYDFTLDFTPEDFRAMQIRSALAAGVVLPPEALKALEMSSGDSLFSAIQALGLKLDARKAPLDVVVIDQVLKTPLEN